MENLALNPLVSVVIPAWGETPHLERARRSILAQTSGELEVVVAAPPPDAPKTANAARLEGLKTAKGEWIAFCDADDWLEPSAVSEMIAAAERQGADCVCCGMVRDSANGESVVRHVDMEGPGDVFNSLCNKLFRRELFKDLVVDKTVTLGEDLMLVAQLLHKARHVAVLDRAFYHYCENPASVTHFENGRKRVEDLAKVDEILRKTMPEAKFSAFHDRVTRDALLLWIRFWLFDRALWKSLRSRMEGGLLEDPRHGFLKKTALACFGFLFG